MTHYQMHPHFRGFKCVGENHYLGTDKICIIECLLSSGSGRELHSENIVLSEVFEDNTQKI